MNPISWLKENLPESTDEQAKKVIEFVFLWQEYNYTYNKRVPDLGDRKGALALAGCLCAQNEYAELKEDFITRFSMIPSLIPENNNPRTKLYINNESTKFVEYHENGMDSFKDFLEVIYQIRCNFMHGEKLRDVDEPIDVELIGWAKDCFEELLERINYFNH